MGDGRAGGPLRAAARCAAVRAPAHAAARRPHARTLAPRARARSPARTLARAGCPVIYRFERAPAGQLRVLPPSASPRNAVNSFCAQAAARGAEDGKDAPILPKFGDFLAGPSDLERLALQQTPLRDAPQCITSGAFGTDLCAYDDPFSAAAKGGAKASETAAARAAEVETGFATVALNGERAESTYQDAFVPLQEAGEGGRVQRRDGQIVVIIRHGKTEQNKLGLFTGWMDVPLAAEGAVEAMRAGQLLREHGIHFDLVYASWLSRSISTAWLVLEQLDALWLPIIKSWRLNERMYGRLTSLSKRMIRTKYGEEQFRLWRRGYDTRPPPISSFSPLYPGNDDRYVTYVTDVRNSVRETVIRSIEAGQLELHPKLPKAESLKDCMERTIPFWRCARARARAHHDARVACARARAHARVPSRAPPRADSPRPCSDVIVPEAISNGKNVLISSSENAIRGLMMHLCDIPPDKIVGVEIPTGARRAPSARRARAERARARMRGGSARAPRGHARPPPTGLAAEPTPPSHPAPARARAPAAARRAQACRSCTTCSPSASGCSTTARA